MIKPQSLKAGDVVRIVAPARKVRLADIEYALEQIRSWGLEVQLGKYTMTDEHAYLAATDEHRLFDFQSALDDPAVKAILSARGGYGSTRILDKLDLSSLRRYPKWIVGYSDITAVHLLLHKQGFASIHGTMPLLFKAEGAQPSIASLRQALFAGEFQLKAPPNPWNRQGSAEGLLIGGNLSLIVDAMGTSTEPSFENAILFIEEIDEARYRVDRMMTQLRRSGKLSKLAALIVGNVTGTKDSDLPFGDTIEQIILNALSGINIPVAFGIASGHQEPNLAWIHGENAAISVDETGSVIRTASVIA